MPQAVPHTSPKPHPNTGRRFGRPINGNAGRLAALAERERRIKQRMRSLAREFGGLSAMSAVDLALLREAASLIVKRQPAGEDPVRRANTIRSLLRAVERRRGRVEAPGEASAGADFTRAMP